MRTAADPFLRSGLALAGANRAEQSMEGLVTAQELMGLDLWGTRLVVLSACDTGVGKIATGEGVLGMRRSFAASGARCMVSSLWSVPDVQTKDLMVHFYREWLSGARVGTALRKAMLSTRDALRKQGKPAHPYFWGAFIAIGNAE